MMLTPEQELTVAINSSATTDADRILAFQTYINRVSDREWNGAPQLPQGLDAPWNPGVGFVASPKLASALGAPFEMVFAFELLAQFEVTSSTSDESPWIGTISSGGLSGVWLNECGAQWLSSGSLVVPLDSTKLGSAPYWHVDVSAIATITLGAAVPVALHAFAPAPVVAVYDVDVESTSTGIVSSRTAFILDASTVTTEIGFRFTSASDPAITCDSITGEVTIKPYTLQAGQSR